MNTFQDTGSDTKYTMTDLEDQFKSIREKVGGIAVKLSSLNNVQISIKEILRHWSRTVIIDAEYERLDYWVKKSLENGDLSKSDLARINVTVQIRREDAFDQLKYFKELDIGVILVTGHKSYFNNQWNEINILDRMVEAIRRYENIIFLGIGSLMKSKIEYKLNQGLLSSKILELLGKQELTNSALWSYYVGDKLSEEATSYLKRRTNYKADTYLIHSLEHLSNLCQYHSVYLYIDIISKSEYLDKIMEIDNY